MGFLNYHLGMRLTEQDISVCHRQVIPEDRKKEGRSYIAPIYCKLLRRKDARDILDRRHKLAGAKNRFGEYYGIRENLTLYRRKLYERVEKELTSFKLGWQ